MGFWEAQSGGRSRVGVPVRVGGAMMGKQARGWGGGALWGSSLQWSLILFVGCKPIEEALPKSAFSVCASVWQQIRVLKIHRGATKARHCVMHWLGLI